MSGKLHLGCGDYAPPGWVNTDATWHILLARIPGLHAILARAGLFGASRGTSWSKDIRYVDLRKPLPFPERSFDVIYSSHVLEHLHRDEAQRLLAECMRCSRRGGVTRMAVPNLGKYISDYQAGVVTRRSPGGSPADSFIERLMMRSSTAPRHATPLHAMYAARMDLNSHKWLYDEDSLCQLFRSAGFRNPRRRLALESACAHIPEVERADRLGGDNTLIVEATRDD